MICSLWRPAKVNWKSIIWKQADVKPYIWLSFATPCWPSCGLYLNGGGEGLSLTEDLRLCDCCWFSCPVLVLQASFIQCLCCLQQALMQWRLRNVSFGAHCWPDWVPNWICLSSISSPVHGASDRESHLCRSLFIFSWGGKWNKAIVLLAVWCCEAV